MSKGADEIVVRRLVALKSVPVAMMHKVLVVRFKVRLYPDIHRSLPVAHAVNRLIAADGPPLPRARHVLASVLARHPSVALDFSGVEGADVAAPQHAGREARLSA